MAKRTFKLIFKDKKDNKVFTYIMGDSYKPFENHFLDFINRRTEKWGYESKEINSKCYGRVLDVELIDLFYANKKFFGFGGLKWATEKSYAEKLENNDKPDYAICPKNINQILWIGVKEKLVELKKWGGVYK